MSPEYIQCPDCGGTYFTRSYKVGGVWRESIKIEKRLDGKPLRAEIEQATTDYLKHGPEPKTLKCEDCGKRIPNPVQ